jgi:polysaccharide biosynthesis protein PslH
MNILFVVPYTPTLIRTRPYNLLRSLAARNHSVTLATVWESEAEQQALHTLAEAGICVLARRLTKQQIARNALLALPGSMPIQARYSWVPALADLIVSVVLQAARPFDVIHVEHLRGAEYGRHLQRRLAAVGSVVPIVWDSVDCISLLFDVAARSSRSRFARWVTRFELPRTRRYEGQAVREFDCVLATSPRDREALSGLATTNGECQPWSRNGNLDGRVALLPNGVDVAYFAPGDERPRPDCVILTGKMSYHANVTAALHLIHDIMPYVWQRRPQAQVIIAGSAPPRAVQNLAAQNPGRVVVTGFVADLRQHIRAATLAVAPIAYGAGIQNKVLEAMACGVPVLASPQASSAIQARAGHDMLVADTDQAFAAAVLQLLQSPDLCQQLGSAGRAYVLKHHQWDQIAVQLERYYAAVRASSLRRTVA